MKTKNMIKITGIMGAVLYLASCAGYFGANGGEGGSAKARPLAIVGGGYLSSDNHNEVTPFLYRDTNGNNPVLFYSSDRDGSYDIYYARMNADGTFQSPVKMGTNVNTTNNDEIFPVVYMESDGAIYLYFLSTNSNEVQEIGMTNSSFGTNFSFVFYTSINYATSIKGLGLEYYVDVSPYGSYLSQNYYKFDGSTNMFQGTSSTNTTPGKIATYSGSGVYYYYGYYSSKFWLTEVENGDHRQLYIHAYATLNQSTGPTNKGILPSYASVYNDRQPCVDWMDPLQEGRVYFSSDRASAGTYDLYRYNIENIAKVLAYYPFGEWLTNNGYTNTGGY